MQCTEKYFEADAFRTRAESVLLAAVPDSRTGGGLLALEGTVFYPEGGGQPADRGTLTPNDKGTGYCLAQADGDVRALTKALNTALNGRGGGKPGICQGSCAATPEQVEDFLKENIDQENAL